MLSSDVETWRAIDGVAYYEVSNLGRIRSLERVVKSGRPPGIRVIKPTIIKTYVNDKKRGYVGAAFYGKRYAVHRLVATAFIGPPPTPKHVVNHLNRDTSDNRVENLEWTTQSGNIKYAFAMGTKVSPTLGKFGKDHPASKPIVSRCMKTGEVKVWEGGGDAVRAGFRSDCISRCCRGLNEFHQGHEWRYGREWPSTQQEGEIP